MKFSSFSSGTEHAVKTWQCSLGVAEDGIMTSELLEKQYLEKRTTDIGNANETKKSTTILPKVSLMRTNAVEKGIQDSFWLLVYVDS
ncbi:hypothetical protein P8452_39333 [Trifolium repens]|nr:hypothetical protein P8452_39333 [Trifolium repens]